MADVHDDRTPDAGNLGFADPVRDAQRVFRGVLTALSRPGLAVALSEVPGTPGSLPPALAAVALTLADYETPIWLDPVLAGEDSVRAFLTFHTGAPITAMASAAALAFCGSADRLPPLSDFAQGSLEYPDRSTTIVVFVEQFNGGRPMTLEGPGIDGRVSIKLGAMPDGFEQYLKDNRTLFPRGVDLILVSGDRIVGLPRSVRVVE